MNAARKKSKGRRPGAPISDKDLRRVDKMLRNLIERLHAEDGSDEEDDDSTTTARVMFMHARLGGVLLLSLIHI